MENQDKAASRNKNENGPDAGKAHDPTLQ